MVTGMNTTNKLIQARQSIFKSIHSSYCQAAVQMYKVDDASRVQTDNTNLILCADDCFAGLTLHLFDPFARPFSNVRNILLSS
jgi:hypothetical protein